MAKKGQTFEKNAKLENLLVDFMIKHKGAENIVSSKELADFCSKQGLSILPRTAGMKLVKLSVERHLPICHMHGGYYWAKTKDELLNSVADLQMRKNALQERIEHLQSFIF